MTETPPEKPPAEPDALAALEREWEARGASAIRTIRSLEPARYLAIIARLLGDD